MVGQEWTVQCSREEFGRLAGTPEFAAIVNLARAVNAIRFASGAFPYQGFDSPKDQRQRINAFMCSLGFLHEGLRAAKAVGQYWRHLPAFPTLAGVRRSDEAKRTLSALERLRNASVFHFDQDQAGKHLASFMQDPCVFACGVGDSGGESYYELADVAAMQAFIGDASSTAEWTKRQRDLSQDAALVIGEFVNAADAVIAEALASYDFMMVDGPHPHSAL